MSHVRTQIREALKTALAGVGEVSASRVYPLSEDDLPIVLVHTNDEEVSGSTHGAYERTLSVVVELRAKGEFYDDDLDALILSVEQALNRSTLGGLCKPLFPTSITITASAGSTAIGKAAIAYRATYFTDFSAPDVAI